MLKKSKKKSMRHRFFAPQNIKRRMQAMLGAGILSIINMISKKAKDEGVRVYLVGGFVRDMILGVKNYDLDVVVEGDAIGFASVMARVLKGSLVAHHRFGTATVIKGRRLIRSFAGIKTANNIRIDFAAARREFYEKPAVLPAVEFAGIKEDLFRRDFTINAMAVSINSDDFGRLISCFGAKEDLEKGIIRALHDKSFIDDPTRIFRAVRFEQRFGFKIEEHTAGLIKNAVDLKMFERTHPHRIKDEMTAILKEKEALNAVKRMDELHELRFIHPNIVFNSKIRRSFRSIDKTVKWFAARNGKDNEFDAWLLYFTALLDNVPHGQAGRLMDKFGMSNEDRGKVLLHKSRSALIIKFLSDGRIKAPSRIFRTLEGLSCENILMLIAGADNKKAKKRICDFLDKYKDIKLKIDGVDLKRAGVKPGPRFGRALEMTLDAKIDGKLRKRGDELLFAQQVYNNQIR